MQNILVIGIGGCGSNSVNRLIQSGRLSIENTCCINTDQASLKEAKAGLRILAEKDNIKQVANEIRKRVLYVKKIVLIAGFGGFTGSNFLPAIVEALIAYKLNVTAVVIKPFNFEGAVRLETARTALQKVYKLLPEENFFIYDNQLIINSVAKNTSLHNTFKLLDDHIFKNVLRSSLNNNITGS